MMNKLHALHTTQHPLSIRVVGGLDVSALPQGSYFLKVGTEQVKFIKHLLTRPRCRGQWGSYGGTSEFMNGTLDEVRVWNVVRTQTEIQDNKLGCNTVSGQTGLVMYYQFNHGAAEGSNGSIAAMSNSANGTTFYAVLNNFALNTTNSNWIASPLCTNIYTWTGTASTDWANQSNWSPMSVPTSTSSIMLPATTNKLTLMANHTINQVSFMGDTKILLGNFNLTTNNLTGGSPTAYVVTNGMGSLTLKDIGTTTTLFPVGPSEKVYAPATITNTVNRNFTVRVGTTLINAAALPNSVGLQWNVTPSVSTGNSATLAFGWSSSSQLTGFNPNTGVQIAHYNGTTWDNFRMATVSGSNPYTATVTGIEVFSPFIVTNQIALPVPILFQMS